MHGQGMEHGHEEALEFQIDPETGRGGWYVRESLMLAPLRGLRDLTIDIATGRMRGRDWLFVAALLIVLR